MFASPHALAVSPVSSAALAQDLGDDVELLAKQVLLSAVGDATRALERTSRSAAALMRCDERGLVPRTAAARTQRTDEASYATKARTEGGEGTSPPSEAQALVKWLLDNVLGALEAGLERHAALFPSGDLGGAAGDVRKVIGALMLQISACLCGVVPRCVGSHVPRPRPWCRAAQAAAIATDRKETIRVPRLQYWSCRRSGLGLGAARAAGVLWRHVAGGFPRAGESALGHGQTQMHAKCVNSSDR